jgi:hypothetical protein
MSDIKNIEKIINRCSMREKLLILAVAFVCIYTVTDRIFMQFNAPDELSTIDQWQNQKIEYHAILSDLESAEKRLKKLPARYEVEIIAAERKARELNSSIEHIRESIVEPKEMINALGQILEAGSALDIITLTHVKASAIEGENSGLYKQEFELIFESDYDDAKNFLEKLKNFDKPLFLDKIKCSVLPSARVNISVTFYSLSDEETFLKF